MEEVKTLFQQIQSQLTEMNYKIDKCLQDNTEIKKENQKLKQKIEDQDGRIEKLEREVRKRNLIIYEIQDEKEETGNMLEIKIVEVAKILDVDLETKTDIDYTRRIGIYKEKQNRPILVVFTTQNKKMEWLRRSYKLKGTSYGLANDLTKIEREERRTLIQHMKKARESGFRAHIKWNKLIVNGEEYTVKDLENEDVEQEKLTNTEETKTKTKRTISERSPDDANMEGSNKRTSQKQIWSQTLLSGFQQSKPKSTNIEAKVGTT